MNRRVSRLLISMYAMLFAFPTVPSLEAAQDKDFCKSFANKSKAYRAKNTDLYLKVCAYRIDQLRPDAPLKDILRQGHRGRYRGYFFELDSLGLITRRQPITWGGTLLQADPSKTGKLVAVEVRTELLNRLDFGIWYKNPDGSISKFISDVAGSIAGVSTIRGSRANMRAKGGITITTSIDLQDDGVIDFLDTFDTDRRRRMILIKEAALPHLNSCSEKVCS